MRADFGWVGLGWVGLDWIGFGLVWFGLVWFGLLLDFSSFEQWFVCAPTYTRRGLKVHHVPGTFVLTKPSLVLTGVKT
jgi:hypothetical protein